MSSVAKKPFPKVLCLCEMLYLTLQYQFKMSISMSLPYKHYQQGQNCASPSYLKDNTQSSKLPQKVKKDLEENSFSPSTSSCSTNNVKDLWSEVSTFYGLPEDLADYEQVEMEESDFEKLVPSPSQQWCSSEDYVSKL